jgi:hypothetical protein
MSCRGALCPVGISALSLSLSCRGVFVKHDEGIPAQRAVNVLIIGLASEDCYVVLRTPHNDKEYVMQRKPFKADEGIPAQSAEA